MKNLTQKSKLVQGLKSIFLDTIRFSHARSHMRDTSKVLHRWSVLSKKSTNGLQTKKLILQVINLLFDIISIPSKALFISIDEPVDVWSKPWPSSHGLPLRGSSTILVRPTSNLCTQRFTVNFVNILRTTHYAHSCVNFINRETFPSIKNQITLQCLSISTAVGVPAIVIFLVTT